MSRVLTSSEFFELSASCSLEQKEWAVGDLHWFGWVPVTWPNTELAVTVEDCDDWREIDFYHPGPKSEALKAVQDHFGQLAEVDDPS